MVIQHNCLHQWYATNVIDAHYVYVTIAKYSDPCIHLTHLFLLFLVMDYFSYGFKRANVSISSSARALYHVSPTCSGSWCNRASLSKTMQSINYSFMRWMTIPKETFWINPCCRTGIPPTFITNKYHFDIFRVCAVCHHDLSTD